MRDSAIQSWMLARIASGWPNVTRETARAHIASSARSAAPMRAHAVVDAARAEAGLGDHEAVALARDQVRGRHAHVAEVDFGVALVVVVAEHRQVAHDGHPGRVDRHQDLALLLVDADPPVLVLPITIMIRQWGW